LLELLDILLNLPLVVRIAGAMLAAALVRLTLLQLGFPGIAPYAGGIAFIMLVTYFFFRGPMALRRDKR
jgi:hypothetical protein